MKRPLAVLAFIFCLGIIASGLIKRGFFPAYALAVLFLLLAILSFRKKLLFEILLSCLVFALGTAHYKNSLILPKNHLLKFIPYHSLKPYEIRGVVLNQPEIRGNKTTFILKAKEVRRGNIKYNCCAKVLVNLKGSAAVAYGEELILKGKLLRPWSFAKAQASYRQYLFRQNIYCLMHIESGYGLTKVNAQHKFWLKDIAFSLREKIKEVISGYLPVVPASIVEAMILGEKKDIPPLLYNSMVRSGTVHILVVSGFNVGIVVCIVILFLKVLRVPKKARFILAAVLLVFYCLATGASNPVVRATVMAIVFMFAYFLKRDADIYNSLAVSALFLLAINPKQLFDIGFQLSFASVFSIVFLYPKLSKLLPSDMLKPKFLRFMADSFLVSLAAWLGTASFTVYYFGLFSWLTPLANLFIAPLASLITLCGFGLVFFAFFWPALASLFALNCQFLSALLVKFHSLWLNNYS